LPTGVEPNAFAKWLVEKELTVETAARLFGMSTSTIYGWRRGNRPPSRTAASRIAKVTEGAVPADSWEVC
jgi:transcriptional regulator with XRE-family HTH domain